MLCHAVSCLYPAWSCGALSKRIVLAHLGSYSPNVTATEWITATHLVASKRLKPVMEVSTVTRVCQDRMKSGAYGTPCQGVFDTLTCD